MQKRHNFWEFKDHNSGRRHENQTNDPIFFICISSPNCIGNSFLHLKIVKIHFHRVPPLTYSGLQNAWILEVKAVRNIHTEENKQSGFTFSIELRIKFKIFTVISWSTVFKYISVRLWQFRSKFLSIFFATFNFRRMCDWRFRCLVLSDWML